MVEDYLEFEASLGYMQGPSLKATTRTIKTGKFFFLYCVPRSPGLDTSHPTQENNRGNQELA